MRHTISILVENKFGVLTRVAGLFSGRGYNIHSLNVAPTHKPELSRMTIVTDGDEATLEQIVKQLDKLHNVIEVMDYREGESINRELVLVQVRNTGENRAEIMQIADVFRGKVVDVHHHCLTVELTGSESKISKFINLMETFGINTINRTGKIALPRIEAEHENA